MRTRLLAVGLIILSGITYWGTLSLKASSFEPLGSAAFPRALAVLIALLSVVLLLQPEKRVDAVAPVGPDLEGDAPEKPTPVLALATTITAVIFAVVLQLRSVNFGVATAVFLMVVFTFLTRFDRKALLPSLAISVLLGFAIDYLFTSVFFVDLP